MVKTLTSTVATTRTYYFAGSTHIAMRDNGTLIFLLSDHLGSTSLTTDASGGVLSVQKYMPYGEPRGTGGLETDYTFTGQRTAAAGLMYYNARHYDPALSHFIEADTIIPEAVQGVMAWNRYAYVNYSAVNFSDPSGHCIFGLPCPDVLTKFANQLENGAKASQIQVTFAVAAPTQFKGEPESNFHLVGYSLVTTSNGGIGLLKTTRDVEYFRNKNGHVRYTPGPADTITNGSKSFYQLGATLSYGLAYGQDFQDIEGVGAFEGPAVNYQAGLGSFSYDFYHGVNENGEVNPNFFGQDFGVSLGLPFNAARVGLQSKILWESKLPDDLIPFCQSVGLCGGSSATSTARPLEEER